MINDLHLVGLGVPNPELDDVSRAVRALGCHGGNRENDPDAMLCKEFDGALI